MLHFCDNDSFGREMTAKFTARAGCARYVKFGFVAAEDVLDDCQPEPYATILPRPAAIDPKEPLSQPRNMFLGNTFPGIAYYKVGAARSRAPV